MAEVGLHGADRHRGRDTGEHLAQGAEFDLVGERGAVGGGLDVADGPGVGTGPLQRPVHGRDLGAVAGRHEAVGAASVQRGGALEDRQDSVAVAQRRVQRLEQDGADRLGGEVAVAVAEAAAAGVGAEQLHLAEGQVLVLVHGQVDPAGDGQLALAAQQVGAGQVDGHGGRGAHAVHGEARAFEAEEVGDAVGDEVVGGGGGEGREHRFGGVRPVHLVGGADVPPDAPPVAALDHLLGDPALFEQVPHGLQEQPLLRVHRGGLAGRDAEVQRVEAVDAVQERPPLGPAAGVPALGGDLGDAVTSLAQRGPELLQVVGVRVAPADADDGDVPARRCRDRGGNGDPSGNDGTGPGRYGRGGLRPGGPGRRLSDECAQRLRVLVREVPGQPAHGPRLEEQRPRQRPEGVLQRFDHGHGEHRVHAVPLQRCVGVEAFGAELEGGGQHTPEVSHRTVLDGPCGTAAEDSTGGGGMRGRTRRGPRCHVLR